MNHSRCNLTVKQTSAHIVEDGRMTSITDFLMARIAEDERRAHIYDDEWTPRVLAWCVAKRAIVEIHTCIAGGDEHWMDERDGYSPGYYSFDACTCCDDQGLVGPWSNRWPCRTLRALAAVYADHPDYRQEWA